MAVLVYDDTLTGIRYTEILDATWKETALAYAMGMRPSEPIELLTAPVRVDRP